MTFPILSGMRQQLQQLKSEIHHFRQVLLFAYSADILTTHERELKQNYVKNFSLLQTLIGSVCIIAKYLHKN